MASMLRRLRSSALSFVASRLRIYRKYSLQSGKVAEREAYWLAALPRFDSTGRISPIIHQIYLKPDLPEPLRRNVERMKATNPGWDHCLYDEDACRTFIAEHYGAQVLELYLRINPVYGAARADLARYLIVYALGGVYLDIKSYFDRPIANVVAENDDFVLAQWGNGSEGDRPGFGLHADLAEIPGGEFQQWHVIAAPSHPFLRAVIAKVLANIETYRPWRHGVGRNGVFRVTGPIAYTRAILPLLGQHPHRVLADSGEIGLRFSIGDEDYRHMAAFPQHYSLQTAPVVKVPAWAKPPAKLYQYISSMA